jgi:shikimate dehydrogenase
MPLDKKKLGLIGYPLGHSFSKTYFQNKFETANLTKSYSYENFPLESEAALALFIQTTAPQLLGFNVTIPYKQTILKYLDGISNDAKVIGAVNTVKINAEGKLIGFNTDAIGFSQHLEELLGNNHQTLKALILGNGGASKAIQYALKEKKIAFKLVGRTLKENIDFTFEQLNNTILKEHLLLINCTPLGTYPQVEAKPNIPYQYLTPAHILYDLVYNPAETAFLKEGIAKKTKTHNGTTMLVNQAEHAWNIWTNLDC